MIDRLKEIAPRLMGCIATIMLTFMVVKSCDVDYKPEIKRLKREIKESERKKKDLQKEAEILIKTIKKIEYDYKINDSIIINNSDSANRELLSKYLSMP